MTLTFPKKSSKSTKATAFKSSPQGGSNCPSVSLTDIGTSTTQYALIPDIEAFEERVAIHIHEGGIPIDQAKDLAAQAQGFRNQAHYWAWLRVYVERKRLG